MGLGAAGCGCEYEKPKYRCKFLASNLFGYRCLKYDVNLEIHKSLKHPIRYKQCCDDAHKQAWSEIMKQRQLITNKIRMEV